MEFYLTLQMRKKTSFLLFNIYSLMLNI